MSGVPEILPEPAPVSGELQDIIDRLPEIAEEASRKAEALLESGVRLLTDTLAFAGVGLPAATGALPALELERHAWVQAALGTDWIDLDPGLSGARPGETLTLPAGEATDGLPDELRHRVELIVTVERIAEGGLAQEVILEHIGFADELADLPLVLLHDRASGLDAVGLSISALLTGTSDYLPVLQVGERVLVGLSGLTFAGAGSSRSSTAVGAPRPSRSRPTRKPAWPCCSGAAACTTWDARPWPLSWLCPRRAHLRRCPQRGGRDHRPGWLVLVPAAPVRLAERERLGWWLVDPVGGRVIDELDDGRGVSMVEKVINVALVAFRAQPAFLRFGLCVMVGALVLGQAVLVIVASTKIGL